MIQGFTSMSQDLVRNVGPKRCLGIRVWGLGFSFKGLSTMSRFNPSSGNM